MEITRAKRHIRSPAKRATRCFVSLLSCCAVAVTAYVGLHRKTTDEAAFAEKTLGRNVYMAKVTIYNFSKSPLPQPISLAEMPSEGRPHWASIQTPQEAMTESAKTTPDIVARTFY